MRAVDVSTNYRSEVFASPVFGELSVLADTDGMSWFRVPDLLKLLDLNHTALRRLDDDERKVIKEIGRRGPGTAYANEPGMYMLVFASRKQEAMRIKRWISHEVLPSIRKHGAYVIGQESLPEDEKASLLKKLEALSAEVAEKTDALAKACAGKEKLQALLIQEEDHNFEKAERIKELLTETKRQQDFLVGMLSSLSSVSFAEKLLQSLKDVASFGSNQEAYAAAISSTRKPPVQVPETTVSAKDTPAIPYAKPAVYDPDPVVRDPFGNIGRRSELLAMDHS